jgi:hypothetical protein
MVLVGVVSFGLGRQSVAGEGVFWPAPPVGVSLSGDTATLNIQNSAQEPAGMNSTWTPSTAENVTVSPGVSQTKVVASRSGTKYHLLDCPGAAQIKEENKVYFESVALAKAAGYTPAANCPGLQ